MAGVTAIKAESRDNDFVLEDDLLGLRALSEEETYKDINVDAELTGEKKKREQKLLSKYTDRLRKTDSSDTR